MSRRRGIRWYLFQVQLVGVVPIGLFAAALLYLHWQAQEHEREGLQIESVRLLAAAVDNALDSTVERLSILARLWASNFVGEDVIYTQAKAALAANADWADILAYRANGNGVFRATEPFGKPVPGNERMDVWRPAIDGRRPVVSDVFHSQRGLVVSVGVPVVRDGRPLGVLVADLNLQWYDRLLARQGFPAGAVAALLDRNFKFVARSSEGDRWRGGDPTPAVVEDLKTSGEGLARYTNLNGTAVYTSRTFTGHGWSVGFATPSAPVDNAFWNHLATFGLLWAAALIAGLAYAFAKARPISAALESLEGEADHFANSQRISGLPGSGVEEVDRAIRALEKASEVLQVAMRERKNALATEREARSAAEAASRAKDEFLAMLGHELRNPLAAISNATAVVKAKNTTPEQLEFVAGVIERQSGHLKRLIDDLLDVGRAMSDKIVLDRAPMDLAACARHVVGNLRGSGGLAQRNVELDLAPAWIDADRTRIEQILNNLLVNAARHTDSDGHIAVRVAREDDTAILRVSDDGQGIASEDLARVFELFYQGESSLDRGGGSLGVGLTLVHRLARLHGGEAHAESPGVGMGATFTVSFPATAASTGALHVAPPADDAQRVTVLIVEDNADARDSLRVALELRGHNVLAAADGASGVELLRADRPSVAVLDIGLPGMDGYEVARLARQELGREIVLIALTGYGTASDQRKAMQAGFDLHLTKPVDVEELVRVVQQAQRRRNAVTRAAAEPPRSQSGSG